MQLNTIYTPVAMYLAMEAGNVHVFETCFGRTVFLTADPCDPANHDERKKKKLTPLEAANGNTFIAQV